MGIESNRNRSGGNQENIAKNVQTAPHGADFGGPHPDVLKWEAKQEDLDGQHLEAVRQERNESFKGLDTPEKAIAEALIDLRFLGGARESDEDAASKVAGHVMQFLQNAGYVMSDNSAFPNSAPLAPEPEKVIAKALSDLKVLNKRVVDVLGGSPNGDLHDPASKIAAEVSRSLKSSGYEITRAPAARWEPTPGPDRK